MQNLIVFIVSALILLCGCSDPSVNRQLEAAEAVMEQHPDSALTILKAINGSRLRGEQRALHALLLSQAYDKNYIDVTSDTLISIATHYYESGNDKKHQMLAEYYRVVVYMNRHDYDKAISRAFDVIKLAEDVGDLSCLAQINHLIGRAYLFSYNEEGATEYFQRALQLSKKLHKDNWIGAVYINLTNLSLLKKDFLQAIEYADSAKKYLPGDSDITEYEMLIQIGLEKYSKADSIYNTIIVNTAPSLQVRAYKLLADFHRGYEYNIEDSLSALLSFASHNDSIEIAGVGTYINQLEGNYNRALFYNNILLAESNKVITDLASHSLYRVQLEHEKREYAEQENALRNRTYQIIFLIIIALLILSLCCTYLYFLRKRHKEHIASIQNEFILITAEYAEIQKNLNAEIRHYKKQQELLNEQVYNSQLAAQELFTAKYAWIEELGNILLDTEASKSTANRALRDLKNRLETVRSKQFISETIDVINKYRSNLIERVTKACPEISDAELSILVLLCTGLPARIISFILDIKPQSIYNAKYSIKRKLLSKNSALIQDMNDIFG